MTRTPVNEFVVFISLAAVLVGCGGQTTHHISGSITFKGKPVPAGHIVFEPDAAAGNSGAPGFAKIKDGHFDTRIDDGRGTLGGPHLVLIHGRDGIPRGELLNGIPLFPDYSTTADLPKKDATVDFEVQAAAHR